MSLDNVHPDNHFWLSDGNILKNLNDLSNALATMEASVYSHHVNRHKNDFHSWVKHVHNDEKLSRNLSRSKTPRLMKTYVDGRIEELTREKKAQVERKKTVVRKTQIKKSKPIVKKVNIKKPKVKMSKPKVVKKTKIKPEVSEIKPIKKIKIKKAKVKQVKKANVKPIKVIKIKTRSIKKLTKPSKLTKKTKQKHTYKRESLPWKKSKEPNIVQEVGKAYKATLKSNFEKIIDIFRLK